MLNTTTVEMEEAKTTFDICAELNVTEVQTKVAARFAVLLDRSLLGKYTHTHTTHTLSIACYMYMHMYMHSTYYSHCNALSFRCAKIS